MHQHPSSIWNGFFAFLVLALLALGGCKDAPSAPNTVTTTSEGRSSTHGRTGAPLLADASLVPKDGRRVVAFGDTHGDLLATLRVLTLAGAVTRSSEHLQDVHWTGGDMVLVQTGDLLDRGDDERAILDLYAQLADEAELAGGRFIPLNGNHEFMNSRGDFRYVTPKGFADFADFAPDPEGVSPSHTIPREAYGRLYAFKPGGRYALQLARNDVIAMVDDTVFVHGALLPEHVEYGIDRLNEDGRAWFRGERTSIPKSLHSRSSPTWASLYSDEERETSCDVLAQTLKMVGAQRMVVGHKTQKGGVTSACDGQIWRIDVGLAAIYGGPTEAIEIVNGKVRVLR